MAESRKPRPALIVSLLLAGAMTGIGPAGPAGRAVASAASASTCRPWSGLQPPSPGSSPVQLNSVAVLSPCDAWAVGSFRGSGGDQTLTEHWNGASWRVLASPSPGTSAVLNGVRAVSPTSAWAVGPTSTAARARP